jgi:integrase
MIALPPFVIEVLRQHRVTQLELRLKAGSAWEEHDLVFTGLHGNYLNPRYILKLFAQVLQDADLPHLRFHDLRHSAATLLLGMGVHPKVVQEILGHSHISMTMDTYSHVLPSVQREAMDKWGVFFGEGTDDKEVN